MAPVGRPRKRTTSGSAPPVTELGSVVPVQQFNPLLGSSTPWTSFVDSQEYVPELQWPSSIQAYDQMRTDSQLAGLLTAVVYGISQLRFVIDPNGAPDEIVKGISEDLNLPIQGQESKSKMRMKNRFSHNKHLVQTLRLALIYGHMFYEQVGTIEGGLWRLRKLSPRMPNGIQEIKVAQDGGLISIRQNIGGVAGQKTLTGQTYLYPEIPVDRLVAYPFEMEGGNWVGRSILRDCYKNWLIKDRLLRIDAINHERAGGVPYGIAPQDATSTDIGLLSEMMQQFRVGDSGGGAVPWGSEVKIASGNNSDVAASIRMHDEAMARRFLLMLANLAQGGQHVGSYALADQFNDLFVIGQRAIVQWYIDITNEHVIEDWVDWNYGEEEPLAPLLAYEGEDDVLGIEQLVSLVDSNIVMVDEELEDAIRYRYKLPQRTAPRPALPVAKPSGGPAGGQVGDAPSSAKPPAQPQKVAAVYDREAEHAV
jgi:hypothetical protein